jgi:Domain of unknown function (DUF6285)
MPRSIPDAPTLLAAAVKYLEEELITTLSGYHRFQTRVTANVLNIVRRELQVSDAQESAEHGRLAAILGHDGSIQALNDELCELIRNDRTDLSDPNLRKHLKQSLADALAINNPRWPAA